MFTTIMLTLSTLLKKFWKYIVGILLLIALIFYVLHLIGKIKELKVETKRQNSNIENMQFKIDTTKLANGKLQYTVTSLTIKENELKYFSEDIYKKLSEMDVKLKNVKGVTNIDYHYTTIIKDSIKTEKISNNLYKFNVNKNSMVSNGLINIPENFPLSNPFVTDLKVTLNDSLIIVPENIYKKRWIFWKKLSSVKLHISSSNPDFNIDRIQTFEITK